MWGAGSGASPERGGQSSTARKIVFSKEGAAELESFHQEVCGNLKLAFSVFMSDDVRMARQLLTEKASLRAAEFAAAESHLARLRDGRLESIESSSVHLDILRDLKRVHSHICSVAYPVLERAGELQPSRLRDTDPDGAIARRQTPPFRYSRRSADPKSVYRLRGVHTSIELS